MLLNSGNKFVLTRWVFLRLLGGIYLLAFWSLSTQIIGLIGSEGIIPANSFLTLLGRHLGAERYWLFPTLAWINASDTSLQLICNSGVILALSVVLGFLTGPALLLLWGLYLSLVIIGQDFLSFQWDILLLETGFLAIFLAPWKLLEYPWRARPILPLRETSQKDPVIDPAPDLPADASGETAPERSIDKSIDDSPSPIVIWLFRWLLFRLMLESGIVKLTSGDPTWSSLTALNFHYITQPLPTPIAWYVAQLPEWFQRLSVAGVFVIELVFPFLIFAPRRFRIFSGLAFIAFQLLIILTGNYAFFNLLTITLSIMLFDDALLVRCVPKFLASRLIPEYHLGKKSSAFGRGLAIALATFIGILSACSLIGRPNLPAVAQILLEPVEHFYCVNSYGLFAVMTTSRLEIIVEGSDDGKEWRPYQFKYKPGELNVPPRWVAPHQPRLDWQMWFAALSDYRSNVWFVNFMFRLLQGSQSVLSLLAVNPFPNEPPHYVRAELYQYKFTDFASQAKTGNWWQREYVGHYLPPVSFTK